MKWTAVALAVVAIGSSSCSDNNAEPETAWSISLSPTATTITQGSSQEATITVTHPNNSSHLTFTVTGQQDGLSATVTDIATSGTTTTATLNLSADHSATPGTSNPAVAVATGGVERSSQSFNVTVAAPATVTVDYSQCPANLRPIWFAHQSGSGPWTVVTPTGHSYQFGFDSTLGSVAYATSSIAGGNTDNSVKVVHLSRNELAGVTGPSGALGGTCPAAQDSTKTLHAAFTGLDSTTTTQSVVAYLSLGGGGTAVPATDDSITLSGVRGKIVDLVARAKTADHRLQRMIMWRNVNVDTLPDHGSLLWPLDFNGMGSLVPLVHKVHLEGFAAPQAVAYSLGLVNCQGSYLPVDDNSQNALDSITVFAPPAVYLRSSEKYQMSISTSDGPSLRQGTHLFTSPANQSVSLPEAMPVPTATQLTSSYARFRFQFDLPPDKEAVQVYYSTTDGAQVSGTLTLLVTPGYIGAQTQLDLSTPDWSALAGWNDSWLPYSANATWVVTSLNADGILGNPTYCSESFFSAHDGSVGSPVGPEASATFWNRWARNLSTTGVTVNAEQIGPRNTALRLGSNR